MTVDAYFERLPDGRFRPTDHVSGAWDPGEQHIGPVMGLLAHLLEQDRTARRDDDLRMSRFGAEILGVLTMDPVSVSIRIARPGRTIELVEAELSQHGRTAVLVRAWLLQRADTSEVAGSAFERMPDPDTLTDDGFATRWNGGFVRSIDSRRRVLDHQRALGWARAHHDLVAGEPSTPLARAIGVIDTANGLVPWTDPDAVLFPNVDFVASFLREPVPGWVGLDVRVSAGPDGGGVTSSIVHDEAGPVGTLAQTLTVRPRG